MDIKHYSYLVHVPGCCDPFSASRPRPWTTQTFGATTRSTERLGLFGGRLGRFPAFFGVQEMGPQNSRMNHEILPSGKLTQLWKITIFNGKTHYKWSFSIATLNYQRVAVIWSFWITFFWGGWPNFRAAKFLFCYLNSQDIHGHERF